MSPGDGADPVARAAQLILEAYRGAVPFEAHAAEAPGDAPAAYRVQDRVFAALYPGVRASAWKVGGPGPGVEPVAAPIAPSRIYHSAATVPAGAFHVIGVEVEIAYRFAVDLPARQTPYTPDEVAAAIGEALVAIELCDARLSNWRSAAAHWKLADFQMNAGLVLGSGTREWRALNAAALSAELWVDGACLAQAVGAHPYGDPVRLMPWAAAHCAARNGGLRAGDVVTTGSWTGMPLVAPGSEVLGRFAGLGEARVRLEP